MNIWVQDLHAPLHWIQSTDSIESLESFIDWKTSKVWQNMISQVLHEKQTF